MLLTGLHIDIAAARIIALIKSCINCTKSPKRYHEDVNRIGIRLTHLLSSSKIWSKQLTITTINEENSKRILEQLYKSLYDLYLCLQAASSKVNFDSWPKRVKFFLQSKNLYDELLKTETKLNIVLNDLQMDQSTVILYFLMSLNKIS